MTGALPCCQSSLKYSITFCGSGNIGKQWLSVDATRILCRGVKKGWIEWLKRLKVEKNKQQKTFYVDKSIFSSQIWYDILIHVSTAHLREMSTNLSVSNPIEKLEASCTNETGHLLLTTSPRTRGQGGQVAGAAGQPGAVWTRNVLSRLRPSGQADPTNYSQLV